MFSAWSHILIILSEENTSLCSLRCHPQPSPVLSHNVHNKQLHAVGHSSQMLKVQTRTPRPVSVCEQSKQLIGNRVQGATLHGCDITLVTFCPLKGIVHPILTKREKTLIITHPYVLTNPYDFSSFVKHTCAHSNLWPSESMRSTFSIFKCHLYQINHII